MELIELSNPEQLTETLNSIKNGLKIVYFYADDLPECNQMSEVIQELKTNKDYEDLCVLKVNAKNAEKIGDAFDVQSVPTFLFYLNGGVVDKLVGANVPSFLKKIDEHKKKSCLCGETDLNTRLKNLINKAPVMLFMKGNPDMPRCGFSKQVIALLENHDAEYETFDILTDNDVREGLKTYSNWPTYPQLYIKGELIGGLDILKELSESGELDILLQTSTDIDDRLKKLINRSPIMVFMKGSPQTPRCGFSKNLVGMLNETGLKYDTFDILEDNSVREGLKIYSNWPTYPQVYVKGNLIGGFDIIKELHESNELKSSLEGN